MNQKNNKKLALILAATMAGSVVAAPLNTVFAESVAAETLSSEGISERLEKQREVLLTESLRSTSSDISNYEIIDSSYMTRLKIDYNNNPVFELGFNERRDGEVIYTGNMGQDILEHGFIQINNGRKWSFKDAGLVFDNPRTTSNFKTENPDFIKEIYKLKSLEIKITVPDGKVVTRTIKNTLKEDEIAKIAGKFNETSTVNKYSKGSTDEVNSPAAESDTSETPIAEVEDPQAELKANEDQNIDILRFENVHGSLLKSHSYGSTSMSGATMKSDAEMLTDENGNNTLVLHFEPAVINGILAYATGLELNEEGVQTEFILKEDNSGICIIKNLRIDNESKIIEGHIYSSVMDADVALKIQKTDNTANIKEKFEEKKNFAKNLLTTKEYYDESKNILTKAVEARDGSIIDKYINIEKAVASLREKKANPFEGDTLFHLNVIDTSTIASKSMEKYARVDIVNNQPVLKVKYNLYADYSGEVYIENVKVFNQDNEIIPSQYELDSNKTGTLTFTMPYIPAGGVFKVELTQGGNGKKWNSDIKLDYGTIKKGPFRELLTETIKRVNTYLDDDYETVLDLEEMKDAYTESSWEKYAQALKESKDDLKRADLTQEEIDSDIVNLTNAKNNLLFKVKAGKANNINLNTKGFNNPQIYYSDYGFGEKPVTVKWSGSKVVFGKNNDVYRVLNNGFEDRENQDVSNGKILLMAEDLRVKKPFTDTETTNLESAVKYDSSLLREYLNNDFYNSNFSEAEKKSILETENTTEEVFSTGTYFAKGRTVSTSRDKIFAPDLNIVSSSKYGYGTNDARYTTNPYALRNIADNFMGDVLTLAVQSLGRVNASYELNSKDLQTAPVMNIDSSKVLLTLDNGINLNNGFSNYVKTQNNLWKMVLKDDAVQLNISESSLNGNDVSINYSGENLQGKNLIAMIVTDGDLNSGTLRSIGKVAELNNSGSASFTLEDFDKTSDKLYLFAAENKEQGTIGASDISEIDMSKRAVDLSKLRNKITEAKEKNKERFTEISVNNLNEKIKESEKLLVKEAVTQNEVNNSLKALTDALKALEADSNKTVVQYTAPVKMLRHNETRTSMADGAVVRNVDIVKENGKTTVIMQFKPLTVRKLVGHLIKMSVGGKAVNVLEHDSENNPVKVSFEVQGEPEKITANVEVDVMNELADGSAPQDVDIVINWSEKEEVSDIAAESTQDAPISVPTMPSSASEFPSVPSVPAEPSASENSGNDILNAENAGNKKSLQLLLELCRNITSEGFNKVYYDKLQEAIKFADNAVKTGTNTDIAFIKLLDAYKTLNTLGRTVNLKNTEVSKTAIEVPVNIRHYSQDAYSMANNAVYKNIFVEEKDGKYIVKIYFKAMTVKGLEGNIIRFEPENGRAKKIPGLNNVYKDGYEFELSSKVPQLTVNLEADVMNELAGGVSSPQKARLNINWKLAKLTKGEIAEALPEEVNKNALKDLINEAEDIARNKYTKDSLKELDEKLKNAKEIYKSENSLEEQVKKAEKLLDSALKNLEKIKDDNEGEKSEIAVPVKIKNASQKNRDSMADKAVSSKVYVTEDSNKKEATYRLYFKSMKLRGMEGNIKNLFVYDGFKKQRASRIAGKGEYTQGFEFTRNKLRESEIRIAVDVDVMNELGAGAQDAILVLDWNNKEVIKEAKTKDDKNQSNTIIDRSPKTASYVKGYSDGSFKPNNKITRAEVATMVSKLINKKYDKASELKDVDKNSWYADDVNKLIAFGIIKGYEDGNFKPDKEMTRAEVAVMISKALKLSANSNGFKDTDSHWAKNYIAALKEHNIINGYSDGSFKPDGKITRAEMVVMINRAFNIIADENKKGDISQNKVVFKDVLPGSWFYKDIMIAK